MKKYLQYIPFLAIFCLAVLLFVKVNGQGKDAGKSLTSGVFGSSPMVGRDMPDEVINTIFPAKGKIDNLTYRGKYTVVNLFASWCAACAYEHKFIKGLKGNSIQLIGISWRDKAEDSFSWLIKNGNPYDVVGNDSLGKYGIYLGITGIPETFVVSPEGKIIMHFAGPVGDAEVAQIKELVAKH